MEKVLKKEYRLQIDLAKKIIKGIAVIIEEGEHQDLARTVKASENLKIVADNIAHLARKMERYN